jgi:hypothetical protein
MSRDSNAAGRLTARELDQLIEEATVDCYDESEQAMGLFTMIEQELALPFKTRILGVEVSVISVEDGDPGIKAICARGRQRQSIPITDLPLPSPAPAGAQWIAAYRRWARQGAGLSNDDDQACMA